MNTAELLSNPEIEKCVIAATLGNVEDFRNRMPHLKKTLFTDLSCISKLEQLLTVYRMERHENDQQLRFWEAPLSTRFAQIAEGWTANNCEEHWQFNEGIRLLEDLALRREWVTFLKREQDEVCTLNCELWAIIQRTLSRVQSFKDSWFPSPEEPDDNHTWWHIENSIDNDDTLGLSPEEEEVVVLLSDIARLIEGKEPLAEHGASPVSTIAMTSAFMPGKLYIISGVKIDERIALLLNLASAALREKGIRVGVSVGPLERRDILIRLMFQLATVDIQTLEGKKLSDWQFHQLCIAASKLRGYLAIHCSANRTLQDIRRQLEKMRCLGIKKVLLIDSVENFETSEEKVCEKLRQIAEEYDSTIVTFG